jgi:hypothetical protein
MFKVLVYLFIFIGIASFISAYSAYENTNVNLILDTGYTGYSNTDITLILDSGEGTPADSCTYTTGNWHITDNCVLTTPVDTRPFSIYLECDNAVNIQANIITDNLYQKAGCVLVQKSPNSIQTT